MAHHSSLEGGLAGWYLVDRLLIRGRDGSIEDCYMPCRLADWDCAYKNKLYTKCCLFATK